MNEEIPYNPPGMDDYIREGARKNSALLRKMQGQPETSATAEAKGGSHQRVVVPPHGEAALEYYKAAFERRRPEYVPDVIKLPNLVASDWHEDGYHAEPGEHKCESNQWGALSVKTKSGKMLGIKPGEFEVISWRHND